MTTAAELHVQAAVWTDHDQRYAVLFLQGEAPDRAHGGAPLVDALQTILLAHGLRMTTDPEQLPLHPVPGWRIRIAASGAVTLEWPHFTPLLADVRLTLPEGWSEAAADVGVVLVFAGRGTRPARTRRRRERARERAPSGSGRRGHARRRSRGRRGPGTNRCRTRRDHHLATTTAPAS